MTVVVIVTITAILKNKNIMILTLIIFVNMIAITSMTLAFGHGAAAPVVRLARQFRHLRPEEGSEQGPPCLLATVSIATTWL